jgi:alkylhydroperoxidase/carboxymuconolactone decarboxylase family protein YurZ
MKAPSIQSRSVKIIQAALQLRGRPGATKRQLTDALAHVLHPRTVRAALKAMHEAALVERRRMDHPAPIYFLKQP